MIMATIPVSNSTIATELMMLNQWIWSSPKHRREGEKATGATVESVTQATSSLAFRLAPIRTGGAFKAGSYVMPPRSPM